MYVCRYILSMLKYAYITWNYMHYELDNFNNTNQNL